MAKIGGYIKINESNYNRSFDNSTIKDNTLSFFKGIECFDIKETEFGYDLIINTFDSETKLLIHFRDKIEFDIMMGSIYKKLNINKNMNHQPVTYLQTERN